MATWLKRLCHLAGRKEGNDNGSRRRIAWPFCKAVFPDLLTILHNRLLLTDLESKLANSTRELQRSNENLQQEAGVADV